MTQPDQGHRDVDAGQPRAQHGHDGDDQDQKGERENDVDERMKTVSSGAAEVAGQVPTAVPMRNGKITLKATTWRSTRVPR